MKKYCDKSLIINLKKIGKVNLEVTSSEAIYMLQGIRFSIRCTEFS